MLHVIISQPIWEKNEIPCQKLKEKPFLQSPEASSWEHGLVFAACFFLNILCPDWNRAGTLRSCPRAEPRSEACRARGWALATGGERLAGLPGDWP